MTERSAQAPGNRDGGAHLAIFDVCDTLYAENTTIGFLHFFCDSVGKRFRMRDRLVRSKLSPFFYVGAIAHRFFHRDIARAWLIRSLRGASRDALSAAARRYVAELLAGRANGPVMDRLAAHRQAGHRVILISSSLDIVVAEIAAQLGTEFRASKLEFRGERCTGRLAADLTGKKHQLVDALLAQGGATSISVYTDNHSDRVLLERADHATIIIPRASSAAGWGTMDAEFIRL